MIKVWNINIIYIECYCQDFGPIDHVYVVTYTSERK